MSKTLVIDDEFRDLLGSHSSEEFEQLRNNLVADGRVLDPIIVWRGEDIIVDGQTRYQIALSEGLPFSTIEIEFRDRAHVKEWIYAHQFGRRNGNGLDKARWRATLVDMIAARNTSPVSKRNAVSEVAEKSGVKERQIWKDIAVEKIVQSLPEQAKKNIERGNIQASADSIMRIEKLPETQKMQVVEILENLPTHVEEEVTFRSLDEVIDAVAVHQTQTEDKPEKQNAKLDKAIARIEKLIAEIPSQIDFVASSKKLHRSVWKERTQAAFANFVAMWREQCRKP